MCIGLDFTTVTNNLLLFFVRDFFFYVVKYACDISFLFVTAVSLCKKNRFFGNINTVGVAVIPHHTSDYISVIACFHKITSGYLFLAFGRVITGSSGFGLYNMNFEPMT